jgi:hypothetical protein
MAKKPKVTPPRNGSSKLHAAASDSIKVLGRKPFIGPSFLMQPIQHISLRLDGLDINTIFSEEMLLLLIRARRMHLARNSQPDRDREGRKFLLEMLGYRLERLLLRQDHGIRLPAAGWGRSQHDSSTTRTAVVVWDFDAIDVCFLDCVVFAQDVSDFGGGNVLSFPAKCVAEPKAPALKAFVERLNNAAGASVAL